MQIGSSGGTNASSMLQMMQQKMQNAFTTADADGDGKLSKTEFSQFDAVMKADAPQGGKGPQGMPSAAQMFSKMNTNGDDSVTLAEIQGAMPPRPPMAGDTMGALLQMQEDSQGGQTAGVNPLQQKMEAAFKASDTDGDGKLSATEFGAFDKIMKADAPAGGPNAAEMFARFDSDGNGSVTLEELQQNAPPPPPAASKKDGDDMLASLIQQLLGNYNKTSDTSLMSALGISA